MDNLAGCYYRSRRYGDALKVSEDLLAIRKRRRGFEHADTIQAIGNVASVCFALGRTAEALKYSRQAAELGEKLDRAENENGDFLYVLACSRAIMAAVPGTADAKESDSEADWAMVYLKRAVIADQAISYMKRGDVAGLAAFKNIEHMKTDKDLDALRGREDFKKLMAELQAEKKAATKEER